MESLVSSILACSTESELLGLAEHLSSREEELLAVFREKGTFLAALSHLDLCRHTVGIAFLARAQSRLNCSTAFCRTLETWLEAACRSQLKTAASAARDLVSGLASWAASSSSSSRKSSTTPALLAGRVACLVCSKLEDDEIITSAHADAVQCLMLAKNYRFAYRRFASDSSRWILLPSRQKSTAADKNNNSRSRRTSFQQQQQQSPLHLLRFTYYAGLACAACSELDRASHFFKLCLSIPSSSSCCSAICRDAFKRLIICQLALKGRADRSENHRAAARAATPVEESSFTTTASSGLAPSRQQQQQQQPPPRQHQQPLLFMPKYAPASVSRLSKEKSLAPYRELAREFERLDDSPRRDDFVCALRKLVEEHSQALDRDGTREMAISALSAAAARTRVVQISRAYLNLSLSDVAENVDTNTDEEARNLVVDMICDGTLPPGCKIVDATTSRTAVVVFAATTTTTPEERPPSSSYSVKEAKRVAELKRSLEDLERLAVSIRLENERILTDRTFVLKSSSSSSRVIEYGARRTAREHHTVAGGSQTTTARSRDDLRFVPSVDGAEPDDDDDDCFQDLDDVGSPPPLSP